MKVKYGDVCLVEYPFTDGTGAKRRPVVVVSANQFNNSGDVVVIPISSAIDHDDSSLICIGNDHPRFARTGIQYPSAVKCTKPMTLARSQLLRKIGGFDDTIMRQVRTILADLLSLSVSD